jgi:putative spermidine/putrescine transport system permease protein
VTSLDLSSEILPVTEKPSFRFGPIWLALPGVAFLLIFFLWPTLHILVSAIWGGDGGFSLKALQAVFASPSYSRVMTTTFTVAIQVTVLCVLISYPLAYWLSRHSARRQRLMMMLILLPFWTSALVKNFAWLVLFGRNSSFAQLIMSMGGAGDRLLFNKTVVLFGIVHTLVPLCVIAMMPTLNQVNKSLLSAATTLGASPTQAFWRIFLPLSMRGVATAGLMIFITSLGFFITPSLLGSPRETMVGQLIIEQINELQNLQQGSAFGVILLAGAIIAVVLFDRVFGLSGMGGGSGQSQPDSPVRRFGLWLAGRIGNIFDPVARSYRNTFRGLPGSRLLGLYSVLVIAILLVPVIAIIPMAFTSGSFLAFPPPGFSLRWFDTYFASPIWMAATARSFGIGVACAALTIVVAGTVAFAVVRSGSRLAGAIFIFFMSPMIVPHLVISIGLFYLFAQMSLIATDVGLVLGHSVIATPVVFIIVLSTLRGHDWRLDDAALTLGASPRKAFFRITLPLISGGIVAGLITAFLISFEELTIALFIGGGLITTLPKQLWSDIFLQINPTLAAASVVVLGVVTVLFLLMEVISYWRKPA